MALVQWCSCFLFSSTLQTPTLLGKVRNYSNLLETWEGRIKQLKTEFFPLTQPLYFTEMVVRSSILCIQKLYLMLLRF